MAYLTLEMRSDYAKCVVVGRSEVAHQITIFTLSAKGIKQIINTIIKQFQICIRRSVYYTNDDITLLRTVGSVSMLIHFAFFATLNTPY